MILYGVLYGLKPVPFKTDPLPEDPAKLRAES